MTNSAVEKSVLIPQIQEQLRSLFASALSQQWTVSLLSAMQPLYIPDAQPQQLQLRPSQQCAAEIAVELAELEARIPRELRQQLLQLPCIQRWALVRADWSEGRAASDQIYKMESYEQMSFLKSPSAEQLQTARIALRLALELAMDKLYAYENGVTEAKPANDQEEDWFTRKSNSIYKLGETNTHSGYDNPVYLCPKEFLQRARGANVPVTAAERVPAPLDRTKRIQQYLQHLPSPTANLANTTIPFEIRTDSSTLDLMGMKAWFERNRENGEEKAKMPAVIARLLHSSLEGCPVVLQQLQALSTVQLAKVVMLDWVDRLVEERRAVASVLMDEDHDEASRCPPAMLEALLFVCSAATIYPDELRKAVKLVIKKNDDQIEKAEAEKKHDSWKVVSRDGAARTFLHNALAQYMSYDKVDAFEKLMVCPEPAFPYSMSPCYERSEWTAAFDSLNMSEAMSDYISQPQEGISAEIASTICRYVGKSERKLAEIVKMEMDFVAHTLLGYWTRTIRKESKGKEESHDNQESTKIECSSQTLAAMIFVCAISKFGSAHLVKMDLKNFCKSDLLDTFDVCLSDASSAPEDLVEWAGKQADAIVQKAQAKLADVFVQPLQLQHMQQPAAILPPMQLQ